MADVITFLDKEELDPNTGVDDKYLIRASDINQLKSAVNTINNDVETVDSKVEGINVKIANMASTVNLSITDVIPDLTKYQGYSVVLTNSLPVVIRGKTINPWSKWNFPRVSFPDFVGYCAYPDASKFWVIGHTNEGYFARQVY